MVKVNLIPRRRLEAYRIRNRMTRWGFGGACYGLFLIIAFVVTHVLVVNDDQTARDELNRTIQHIESSKTRLATLRHELQEVSTKLRTSQAVGQQPDWSVLLAVLADTVDSEVVLKNCRVEPVRMTSASNRRGLSDQGLEQATELRVEVAGLGRTPQAVAQFVLRLEECPLFSKVNPADTNREVFQGQYATAFRIECVLSGDVTQVVAVP